MIGGGGLSLAAALFWNLRDEPIPQSGAGQSTSGDGQPSTATLSGGLGRPRLSPGISQITDPDVHWEERVLAVRKLPPHLDGQSVAHLLAFLKEPPATGEENWYLVCNEIMEVLRKRNMLPGSYTRSLTGLIISAKADPIIRDYAVQHLAQWIGGLDPAARELDEVLAGSAFTAMLAEAAKPENGGLTLSGTALHALTDAVTSGSHVMRKRRGEVAQLALAMIEDEAFSSVNRSSAIQAAARLEAEGLSLICREMAADSKTPSDLRLSSIAALGLIGSKADISFIKNFADDEPYKFAAAAALERLTAHKP